MCAQIDFERDSLKEKIKHERIDLNHQHVKWMMSMCACDET